MIAPGSRLGPCEILSADEVSFTSDGIPNTFGRQRMRSMKTIAAVFSIAAAIALLNPLSLTAQRESSAKAGRTLKTAWGHPDLQGVWDFSTNTPLQRRLELKDKTQLTDAEAAEQFEEAVTQRTRQDNGPSRKGDTGTYNRFWTDDPRVTTKQTSLVVDPPDGRIPAYTPQAQKWYADTQAARKGVTADAPTPGGFVEDLGPRHLFVRCLVGFNAGPPINPQSYNQNVQIFQGPDHVALLHEMVHNARVVWLDGRPHASNRIAQYNGDSRGRWEGDTLIVETTNFGKEVYDPSYSGGGMRPNVNGTFKLVERFTRTGPDVLEYQFTINDPTWYTAPFTAKIPMTRNPKPLYEFACHEGNYSLPGILEGARRQEAETAKQRTNPSSK